MKEHVKTDKFDCECDYLRTRTVYEAKRSPYHADLVTVVDDYGRNIPVILSYSSHTASSWYLCDANGDKLDEDINTIPTKTITICVEKTLRYNQEVKVTVDEYERLSNLNQDDLSKELAKLFDEDVADLDDVDIKVDSYDFED